MNQIIQLCLQRADCTYSSSSASRNLSCDFPVPSIKQQSERSQESTEGEEEVIKKIHNKSTHVPSVFAQSSAEPFLKCENTPQLQQKMESLCMDEESFNLDEVLFNECDNLSHISENGNASDKWQEESIDHMLYSQRQKEEDDEKKQQEEYFQILHMMDPPKFQRMPENMKAILENPRLKQIFLQDSSGCAEFAKLQQSELPKPENRFVAEKPCVDKAFQPEDLSMRTESNQSTQRANCNFSNSQNVKPVPSSSSSGTSQQCVSQSRCMLNPQWLGKAKCNDCKARSKQELKKQKLENLKKTYEQYEKEQNEIYIQAVRAINSHSSADKQRIVRAFKETEQEVDKVAKSHAIKFCLKHGNSEMMIQITAVYKMLLLPEGPLEQYVKSQQKPILKQEYKSFARNIHPDKNPHPQATVAFKKMKKYWFDIARLNFINNSQIN